MAVDLDTVPHPDTLPIPDDVTPNDRWSPLMVEIADHIGPRETLELVRRFGGQQVYISMDPSQCHVGAALSDQANRTISRVFGGEWIRIPTARAALAHARRQGVLARVRAGELNLTEAAIILRTGRRHLTHLINATSEGCGSMAVEKGAASAGQD